MTFEEDLDTIFYNAELGLDEHGWHDDWKRLKQLRPRCLDKQRVREVLEKHAKRPLVEGQIVLHQDASRKAEAKIKKIIEELGL